MTDVTRKKIFTPNKTNTEKIKQVQQALFQDIREFDNKITVTHETRGESFQGFLLDSFD